MSDDDDKEYVKLVPKRVKEEDDLIGTPPNYGNGSYKHGAFIDTETDVNPYPPNYGDGFDYVHPDDLATEVLQSFAKEMSIMGQKEHEETEAAKGVKETNPKDAVGVKKSPQSVIPRGVVQELGLAMLEGARKYGRHNYRVAGVRASVYYDAAYRHMDAWWEGEDIDPDSGMSHVIKAIATLTVLRDAMVNEMWTDDRPPPLPAGWMTEMNIKAGDIIERYPDAKDPFIKGDK